MNSSGKSIARHLTTRHEEVSGTLALKFAVVSKLDVGRAVDPIRDVL